MKAGLEPGSSTPEVSCGLALEEISARWIEAMRKGDFEAAWRQTDRIEHPRREAERQGRLQWAAHHLVWNGASFAGRRVLVRCEHGLGDTIQFVRYVPMIRHQARSVILKAQPDLLALLQELPGADQVINAWTTQPEPAHDVAIECMELPYAFRSTLTTLPAQAPYLAVEKIRTAARIAVVIPKRPLARCRVGLVWASSRWHTGRSLGLASLASLGDVLGVAFYSLQQGPARAELVNMPFEIVDLSLHTQAVLKAAAAMLEMDLIIAVDTMPAHLAGALGLPVWVLLTHSADWRWMTNRTTSLWYPTMRLFRQPTPGDWDTVVAQVAEQLRLFADAL